MARNAACAGVHAEAAMHKHPARVLPTRLAGIRFGKGGVFR
jgi:hypothetical protein